VGNGRSHKDADRTVGSRVPTRTHHITAEQAISQERTKEISFPFSSPPSSSPKPARSGKGGGRGPRYSSRASPTPLIRLGSRGGPTCECRVRPRRVRPLRARSEGCVGRAGRVSVGDPRDDAAGAAAAEEGQSGVPGIDPSINLSLLVFPLTSLKVLAILRIWNCE
jgi:hypothetical protein